MVLSLIAAADEDNVIGLGNTLPWNLPADLRHFRETTKGHPVIMGRRTFESIVERHGTALPDRRNIVITRSVESGKSRIALTDYDVDIVSSMEDAVALAKNIVDAPSTLDAETQGGTPAQGEAFVIGGAQIYELAMPFADRIHLTRIHGHFEGDVFFPPISPEWRVVSEERHEADQENPSPYTFIVYERKR